MFKKNLTDNEHTSTGRRRAQLMNAVSKLSQAVDKKTACEVLGVSRATYYRSASSSPDCFGCIEDARTFCRSFFDWYNKEHKHSGIGMMTPEQVHYGQAQEVFEHRSKVLTAAFDKFPNRFKGRQPVPMSLPEAAWINRPVTDLAETPD